MDNSADSSRDMVFSCPSCGHPNARTKEPDVDIHPGATYHCDQCGERVIFEALTVAEYVALAARRTDSSTYP